MNSPLAEPALERSRSSGVFSLSRLRGNKAILALYPLLSKFASACGQAGDVDDLPYFLSKPGIISRSRTPVLLLITHGVRKRHQPLVVEDLAGAVLLYEYSVAGIGMGLFTSNDRSGRNTVVAPPELRSHVDVFVCEWLAQHGAHFVALSFRNGVSCDLSREMVELKTSAPLRWATRTREIADFLPLRSTYEETLAAIGQRTRSNMRYFRRRTERELGCTFYPELEITLRELVAFNRACMFAVPNRVAAWRLRILRELASPILMGLRDRNGRLLSVLGGRRIGTDSEILWQMNRHGLPFYSLSLVLRSYFLEHEISHGAQRFRIEGGSSHPIRHSFRDCEITDLIVFRDSVKTALARYVLRHWIRLGNDLVVMFFDSSIVWQSVNEEGSRVLPRESRGFAR